MEFRRQLWGVVYLLPCQLTSSGLQASKGSTLSFWATSQPTEQLERKKVRDGQGQERRRAARWAPPSSCSERMLLSYPLVFLIRCQPGSSGFTWGPQWLEDQVPGQVLCRWSKNTGWLQGSRGSYTWRGLCIFFYWLLKSDRKTRNHTSTSLNKPWLLVWHTAPPWRPVSPHECV